MIGGTAMSLVCGRSQSGMTEYQRAGCSRGWMQQLETTVARWYAGTCSRCDEDERRRWRPGN